MGEEEFDEDVMNLAERVVTGWMRVVFVARDDFVNERRSMMVGEVQRVSVSAFFRLKNDIIQCRRPPLGLCTTP